MTHRRPERSTVRRVVADRLGGTSWARSERSGRCLGTANRASPAYGSRRVSSPIVTVLLLTVAVRGFLAQLDHATADPVTVSADTPSPAPPP